MTEQTEQEVVWMNIFDWEVSMFISGASGEL